MTSQQPGEANQLVSGPDSGTNSPHAWVVRAGLKGEAESSNLSLGRASIGWFDVPDMTAITKREQVREIVDRLYPDASPQSRAGTTGQLWAFRGSIADGDLIVMPLVTRPGLIALGRCTGTYGYDPQDEGIARHFLPVQWQQEPIPRDSLQRDLLAMVNGAKTVFSVSRNDAVERLQALAERGLDPGFSDDGNPAEPVRRWLLYRAALQVMSKESPLRRAEVLARVGELLRDELSDYERATFRERDETRRWENNLTWGTTDMVAAGWMTKEKGWWGITDAGREALATHPDGVGLDAEAGRAYREKIARAGQSSEAPRCVGVLEAALDAVEPGTWTTYGDLAAVASTNAQTVGTFANTSRAEGTHRILGKGGRTVPGFAWADGDRTETQREALEAEGVVFDAGGTADESQHVRVEDLRDYLETQGVLEPLPRRGWLVRGSSVDGHDLIPSWLRDGFASLRAAKLREVDAGISRAELKEIVDEDYSQTSYAAKAAKLDEFHAFLTRMRVGDIVATTSQGKLYVGTVSGPAEYLASASGLSNLRRDVDWSPIGHDYGDLAPEVKARLQIQYDVVEMTQQLDLLDEMLAPPSPIEVTPAPVVRELTLPDATDDLAEQLHVERAWLQECVDLLRDRPQLIFYGPPGTGKTYIAQHLAAHLAGDNVRLVQFHPAYSYEDFFEGYRPLEEGGFKLKPGPLRKVVDAARDNPSAPYFLIIDEINRGNLAKIFGELYFLLEYRNQNVDLLYATDDDIGFTLPENVFIIGTMNTADRSIALVDAAMRRRFAFVPLHPSEPPARDVLRRWLAATGRDGRVAELLDELNRRIEDDDFKIGPSYFMRDAVHVDGGLERAWRTAILPLLEEHHYGDGVDVRQKYGLDAIRAKVPTQGGAVTSDEDQPADPA